MEVYGFKLIDGTGGYQIDVMLNTDEGVFCVQTDTKCAGGDLVLPPMEVKEFQRREWDECTLPPRTLPPKENFGPPGREIAWAYDFKTDTQYSLFLSDEGVLSMQVALDTNESEIFQIRS